jgi:tRNA (adenine57-N1/adenine58-N1)-methyltransferase
MDLKADAVVLDIPDPWEAVENVKRMMKGGGRFCAFVPNMNQVESTVIKLRASGFVEIDALENIQRTIEVHPGGVRPSFDTLGHTGYMVFARKVMGGAEAKD